MVRGSNELRQYAIRRPVENTYLVRQLDRRRLRELLGVFGIVCLVGSGLLAYTWVHIEIMRTGYQVNDLERTLERLQEEERRYRLEASFLAHPRQLEERSAEELGMVTPTLEQTVFFHEMVP